MSEPLDPLADRSASPAAAGPPPAGKVTHEVMAADEHEEVKAEHNPFTERDWRMRVYAWSGFAVRLGFIAGGLFSLYQYLATVEEKRIDGTFALLEIWERPEYQQAQLAVRQRIGDLNRKYANLLGKSPSPADLAFYMERIGVEAMTPGGGAMPYDDFKLQFDRLVYFLNRVATCVQAGRCSQKLTDDYFRDLSVSTWGYFSKYVRQVRAGGSTTFAAPIEEYVTGKRPDLTNPLAAGRT